MTHIPLWQNELGPFGKFHEPSHVLGAITRALLAVDRQAKLVAWTGLPGRGKTVAAGRLLEQAWKTYPNAQAPAYYHQLAGSDGGSNAGQRAGIYNVYSEMLQELSAGRQSAKGAGGMIKELVEHFRLYGTRLLILDEAGTQSAEQLRGITQITDVAKQRGSPVTIVLVGMDGLVEKLHKKEQVKRRVEVWETFRDWDRGDQEALVLQHGPTLPVLREQAGFDAVMETLLTHAHGCVGTIVQHAVELEQRLTQHPGSCTVTDASRHLKAHLRGVDQRRMRFAA